MTIRELAKLTGKSYATVSRALNDSPKISEETKNSIKKIAREKGYRINAGAKSLATGIHMTIGVLYPYHHLRAVESVYTDRLINAVREELAARNFDTLITGYDTIGEDTSLLTRLVREKKVDGLLILGYEVTEQAVVEARKYTDKVILINPIHENWIRNYDYIMIDHHRGGKLAAAALLGKRWKKLCSAAENMPQFLERIRGFETEINKYPDASCSHFHLDSGSYDDAYRFGLEYLSELKKMDGLFVQSDNSAFGIMNALQDSGVHVPEDLAIIGYDDVDWCGYSRPALSTIHQPKTQVAEHVADVMVKWVMEGKDSGFRKTLDPIYVDRESC